MKNGIFLDQNQSELSFFQKKKKKKISKKICLSNEYLKWALPCCQDFENEILKWSESLHIIKSHKNVIYYIFDGL